MPSDKIKSKDLSYDATLPPFLQRLHAQKAGLGDGDRHDFTVARPKRVKQHDEDDGPTVVDESGDFVSKEEYERMQKGDAPAHGNDQSTSQEVEQDDGKIVAESSRGEQVINVGVSQKKRKAIRVIAEQEEKPPKADASVGRAKGEDKRPAKKTKPKSKKIKLAFDDEDG